MDKRLDKRYLTGAVSAMEKQYGAEKTDAIIEDAWRRYAEIVDENADEPKKMYMHIANEEKVFDGFLRTINTEILGADLIDVGLILRALTVETLFVKIKVHLTKRFFILTERSFACNVFSCTF